MKHRYVFYVLFCFGCSLQRVICYSFPFHNPILSLVVFFLFSTTHPGNQKALITLP
jgi:hypothetical protein